MSKARELKEAIQKLAGTFLNDRVSIVLCTVDSVDTDSRTCDVTPIGGDATTAIPSVQLMAEANDGWLLIPKVDSTVMVAYSTRNIAFVCMFSDIEKVFLVAGTSIQLMDGSFDGLVKVKELTDKLNNLENAFNQHLLAYNLHTHVGVTVGAGVTGITTPDTQNLTPTVQTEIENTKITHGS